MTCRARLKKKQARATSAPCFCKNTRLQRNVTGQIITTSAEVTLNGGLVRESPQNPLNSG